MGFGKAKSRFCCKERFEIVTYGVSSAPVSGERAGHALPFPPGHSRSRCPQPGDTSLSYNDGLQDLDLERCVVKHSRKLRLLLVLALGACAKRSAFNPDQQYAQIRLLEERGDLQSADELAGRAAARFQSQPGSDDYWRFRLLQAEARLLRVHPDEAAAILAGSPEPTGSETANRLLFDRGWLAYERDDYGASSALLDRALAGAEANGLSELAVEIRLRRGAARSRHGDASGSQADFARALEQARQLRDHYWEAVARANIATAQMNRGEYDEAIAGYERVLELSRPLQSKSFDSRFFNNLGYCYLQLGQPERAAPLFDRGQQLARETGVSLDLHYSLGRMGDWYASQGQPAAALPYYQHALDIARQAHNSLWAGRWLYHMSAAALDLGDEARAADWNRQAESFGQNADDPLERLWPAINHARIAAATGNPKLAEMRYRSVIAGASRLPNPSAPELILEARGRLASLFAAERQNAEADSEFRQAMALADASNALLVRDDSRMSYFATLLHIYQDYVDFLMSEHRDLRALEIAESSRARVLAARIGAGTGVGAAVGSGPKRAPSPPDYRQLSRRTQHTLLSYWLGSRRSFLWVVTPDRVSTFTLPPQEKIESLAKAYASAIDNLHDPLNENDASGRELFRVLLAPAAALVPRGSRVAMVPDGVLYTLNFETLPSPGPPPHYWIDDVLLTLVPSLDLAASLPANRSPDVGSALAIGDPAPPNSGIFPRLPYAAAELGAIQHAFPGATVRSGAAAAPDAYLDAKPERFSLIHFAAHADANSAQPLDSAIILSANGDRYKLYARDVVGVPIRANLVTLSACRSAGSRTYGGEGLVGFAWAFLEAGARRVVGGLWEVDDRSTSELMTEFYAGLARGSKPSEALRQAKLTLRASRAIYGKPYYWGPFELISDSLGDQ